MWCACKEFTWHRPGFGKAWADVGLQVKLSTAEFPMTGRLEMWAAGCGRLAKSSRNLGRTDKRERTFMGVRAFLIFYWILYRSRLTEPGAGHTFRLYPKSKTSTRFVTFRLLKIRTHELKIKIVHFFPRPPDRDTNQFSENAVKFNSKWNTFFIWCF